MVSQDLDYENSNIINTIYYPDGGIKCKNYLLCKSVLPKWWWECKRTYLCFMCESMKCGIITFHHGEIKCDGCNTVVLESIQAINCKHLLCTKCIKKCYYHPLKLCIHCKK
jgi:hypothetical protein